MNRVDLYIGQFAASLVPVVLSTVLGSCVSVCLYDPVLRCGGMNHILLPSCVAGDHSSRCGVHAMELLINELMNLGGDRRRFVAKAFGGANVMERLKLPQVGLKNTVFVREFLAAERIPLLAERMGGQKAVRLHFHTDSGKATVHSVDGSDLPRIMDAENSCRRGRAEAAAGEITLF